MTTTKDTNHIRLVLKKRFMS